MDHVDTLLEDWYPSIGTRFVHTSEGKYLVTRLIPCPRCFPNNVDSSSSGGPETDEQQQQGGPSTTPRMSSDSGVGQSPPRHSSVDAPEREREEDGLLLRTRAGLSFETPKFGSTTSYSSGLNFFLRAETKLRNLTRNMYSWSVEHCILNAQDESGQKVKCPKHGDTALKDIAPDLLFLDLNPRFILPRAMLTRNQLLGSSKIVIIVIVSTTTSYITYTNCNKYMLRFACMCKMHVCILVCMYSHAPQEQKSH